MKNKNFWILFIIFAVGIILRVLFLDKSCGLSYDELVSYKQAAQPNIISTIFYTLKTDVHMPFYQVLLHWWCKIFSLSDLAFRSFSAFCGILSIITAYFIGKELRNHVAQFLCPALFAINSFFIYYSQEVRMYSLLILLATLSVLFFLRIKNNTSNKWNYFGLAATCFALINTYTIAFIYVTALIITLFVCHVKNKQPIKSFVISMLALVVLCLPTFLFMLANPAKWTSEINGYYCDWSSLFIVIQDLFSPVLESLGNNPMHYIQTLFTTFSLVKLGFIVIPVAIALFGIYTAIKKNKTTLIILIPSIVFLLAEIIAFQITNFKILPRYTAVSMPAFLIATAYGFALISKNKRLNIILPTIFILLNLVYLTLSSNAAYKFPRVGFKPLATTINSSNANDGDIVLVWNRKEVLDKYLDKKLFILSILKDFAYKSETMLFHEQEFSSMLIPQRKEILQPYFSENKIPNNTLIVMSYIINNMQHGQKFIITASPNFISYDKVKFKELVENKEEYNSTSLNDLFTIKSLTDIKDICDYNLKFVEKKDAPPYTVLIYTK